jgi:hypothetical protein
MFRFRTPAALALVLALTAGGSAAAQQDAAPGPRVASNTFFVELGGNALVYSVNYERFFTPKLGVRVGGMYLRADDDAGTEVGVGLFPVMGTYLLGVGNSHFETGAGIGIATAGVDETDVGGDDWGDSAVYLTGTLGYRYQKPEGGVIFRAGFTPIFADGNLLPWVGVSVGYAF